jgi:ribosome-associated translation inhibitor RaiA
MSNRLTKAELDAVIGVAGDALAAETLSSEDDPEAAVAAFESGMEKLRRQLGNMNAKRKEETSL